MIDFLDHFLTLAALEHIVIFPRSSANAYVCSIYSLYISYNLTTHCLARVQN